METSSGPVSGVSGMDASKLYSGNGAEASEDRAQIVSPHDSCTILAQESDGSVFSSPKGLANVAAQKAAGKTDQCQVEREREIEIERRD